MRAPHFLEKLPLRHDEARMPGKAFKDAVLKRGQMDVPGRTLRRAARTRANNSGALKGLVT